MINIEYAFSAKENHSESLNSQISLTSVST